MNTKESFPKVVKGRLTYRDVILFGVGVVIGIGADVLLEPGWLYPSFVRPSIVIPPRSSSPMMPPSLPTTHKAPAPLMLAPHQVMTCFTPAEKCAPTLVDLIHAAKERIDVRIYTFTSKAMAEALIAAKGRGVKIRVLCDGGQRTSVHSRLNDLEQAGIEVKVERVPGLAHNKVMILDGAVLVTGSYNFTQGAETRNAENVLILRQADVVKRYQDDWERAWRQSSYPRTIQ